MNPGKSRLIETVTYKSIKYIFLIKSSFLVILCLLLYSGSRWREMCTRYSIESGGKQVKSLCTRYLHISSERTVSLNAFYVFHMWILLMLSTLKNLWGLKGAICVCVSLPYSANCVYPVPWDTVHSLDFHGHPSAHTLILEPSQMYGRFLTWDTRPTVWIQYSDVEF